MNYISLGVCILFLLSCDGKIEELYVEKYQTSYGIHHRNAKCDRIPKDCELIREDIGKIYNKVDLCPVCITTLSKYVIEDLIGENILRKKLINQRKLEWIKKENVVIRKALAYSLTPGFGYSLTSFGKDKINELDINNYAFYKSRIIIDDVVVVDDVDLFFIDLEREMEFKLFFKDIEEVKLYFIRSEKVGYRYIVTENQRCKFNSEDICGESGKRKLFITTPDISESSEKTHNVEKKMSEMEQLYSYLKIRNSEMPDFNRFMVDMKDKNKRRQVYDGLKVKYDSIMASFEIFSKYMGCFDQ